MSLETRNITIKGINLTFIRIPAGKFTMGSPDNEPDRWADEGSQHEVTIDKDFWMLDTLVTQELWETVMGINPSNNQSPQYPVESVSWNTIMKEFIPKIAELLPEDLKPDLPTEEEWEYACRAGTTTAYSFGDDPAELDDYAWFNRNSNDSLHPVRQKKPNPWGLYDMHGLIFEWCKSVWKEYEE